MPSWKNATAVELASGYVRPTQFLVRKRSFAIMVAACIVQGKIIKKEVVFPEECIDPKSFLGEAYKEDPVEFILRNQKIL
jgi:hypothetical protein